MIGMVGGVQTRHTACLVECGRVSRRSARETPTRLQTGRLRSLESSADQLGLVGDRDLCVSSLLCPR